MGEGKERMMHTVAALSISAVSTDFLSTRMSASIDSAVDSLLRFDRIFSRSKASCCMSNNLASHALT
jgi:hypothetical protein